MSSQRLKVGGLVVAVGLLSFVGGISVASKDTAANQQQSPAVRPEPPKNGTSTVVRASDGKVYDIPGGKVRLYEDAKTDRLSCAFVQSVGRYPEAGQKLNKVCTEAIFVLDGEITVTLGADVHVLKKHDVVYIVPNTPYSIEGKADVFVFIEPKWDKTQNVPVP